MPTTGTMRPITIKYIRYQLRISARDLDDLIQVPPGTIESAEDGTVQLAPAAIGRLRHQIKLRENAGTIPERPHLGMLIRQARVAMGLTQTEVAARVGLGQSTYARLEQSVSPKLRTVQRIAVALEIPLEWILRGTVPLTGKMDGGILPDATSDSPQS
jgi:DNA-binding XRE family transcriptional regulator